MTEQTPSDKRHTEVANLLPASWNRKPFTLATELRAFLQTVKDEGTNIDSGSGDGCADLWVTIGGIEYYISIAPSRKSVEEVLQGNGH
jgi:hypothetical protein